MTVTLSIKNVPEEPARRLRSGPRDITGPRRAN